MNLLRSNDPLLVLMSLAGQPCGGYLILKNTERMNDGRVTLTTGALYGVLQKLRAQGWIEPLEENRGSPACRSYKLTSNGWRNLQAELERARHHHRRDAPQTSKPPSSYVAAMFVLAVFGSETALAGVNSGSPTLTVLLFNYSKATPAVLSRTKQKTDNIFRRSGIHFAWIECRPMSGPVVSQLCRYESAPGEIRIRILDRCSTNSVPDATFGFVIHPVWVNIYYEPALRLVQSTTDSRSNVSVILGYVIAHEIGHLLLGQDAHSANGIMQAHWDNQQVQQAMMGMFGFTSAQSKLILRNARLRTNSSSVVLSRRDSNEVLMRSQP